MKKIYKIAQYNQRSIQIIGNSFGQTNRILQGRNQQVRTTNSNYVQSEVDILLNKEFSSEEEAIAALASCNFTDDQLKAFEIVVQLRNSEPDDSQLSAKRLNLVDSFENSNNS